MKRELSSKICKLVLDMNMKKEVNSVCKAFLYQNQIPTKVKNKYKVN